MNIKLPYNTTYSSRHFSTVVMAIYCITNAHVRDLDETLLGEVGSFNYTLDST